MVAFFLDQTPPAAVQVVPAATERGHVTGVGGVFIKAENPRALAKWYQDVLGIRFEAWGGALLRYDTPRHPTQVVWRPFSTKSQYFAPSTRDFMLDFAVDDLDAFVERLKAKGVAIISRDDSDPHGRFAWILDPEGTKIELREERP